MWFATAIPSLTNTGLHFMEICILKLQSKEPGARSDQIQIPNLTVLVCMCLVLLLSDGLCKAATLWSAEQERDISRLQA